MTGKNVGDLENIFIQQIKFDDCPGSQYYFSIIAQDPSIILVLLPRILVSFLVLFKKHDKLNLANFTKNRQSPNLIPCQIFCLYGSSWQQLW